MSAQPSATRTERAFSGASKILRGHGGFVWLTLGAIAFGLAAIDGLGWLAVLGAVLTVIATLAAVDARAVELR